QPDSFTVTLSPGGSDVASNAAALKVRTELTSENTGAPVSTEEFRLLSGTPLHAVADTAGLPDGGYIFRIGISKSAGNTLLNTGHYFVCVGQEYPELKSDLVSLGHSIEQHSYRSESLKFARSSFMFLEYLVKEAAKVLEEGTIADTFSTSAYRRNLDLAQESVREAKTLAEVFANDTDPLASKLALGTASNADPLAGQTGVIQRAYLSTFHRELRPYTVFVPSTYDPARPTPLIALMLTPGPTPDWRSSPAERGSVHSESLALAEKKGYLIVWPTGRRLEAEVNFFDVLREMKQDYNIDEDRIYMMGVSGGGLASWLIGLRFPEQIAAICPISALTVVSESTERPEKTSTALLRERSAYHFPMNALHVPVIMLHGDADTTSLCELQARPMARRMNELGLELEYVEYPGVGHGLGDSYADGFARALAFFDRHRNVRHPRTIDYSTPGMRYNKAYWIRIGGFQKKGRFARVEASAEGNTVEIRTENVAGFSILRDEVVFDVAKPLTVFIDRAMVYKGPLPTSGGVGFSRASGGDWHLQ
ncbi:MAG: prolyl oligopeptidase family serine peptidase, partial [Planctomycetaceae bacterium]